MSDSVSGVPGVPAVPARSSLFDALVAAGPVASQVGDEAWVRAMLDVESALAAAQADAGLLAWEHARSIAEACRDHGAFDVTQLRAGVGGAGDPAAPLVRALSERVGGEAARFVHRGATGQDVVDSAAMLVAARAREPLLADVEHCTDALAALARAHVGSVQVGRTLAQHAPPVTFGLTAAGWLTALDAAADRVRALRFPVQLGGAVGTLASFGEYGPDVVTSLAARLGLAEPVLPWHTDRTPVVDLAAALGGLAAAVSAVAASIVVLAQTDVAELHEEGPPGSGGASTMPPARNPLAAVSARACAKQAPGLVADLLAAAEQENQRAAGAWHAEWWPLIQLWRVCGSAVHWLRESLRRLRVDEVRMRENLDAHGGLVLDDDPAVTTHLSRERIQRLLDPVEYLGSASVFVERALTAYGRSRRER